MHSLLLFMLTSWLVLLQESHGLRASPQPDVEFLQEAMSDGFIVATKEPTISENAQENNNGVIFHDAQSPGVNRSQFQKDSLTMVTVAKTPEATGENTIELTKNENAAVTSIQPTTLFPESQAEGSGVFPDLAIEEPSMTRTAKETLREVDVNSEGSGMFSDPLATTPGTRLADYNISTSGFVLLEENKEVEIGSESRILNHLTTPERAIVEEVAVVESKTNDVNAEKSLDERRRDPPQEEPSQPEGRLIKGVGHDPKPVTKEGTPAWLLIVALCLTLLAVICAFVAVATKDMWYGPSKQCRQIKSAESQKQEEYNKATALTLSDKEKVALMSVQNKTDCAIISMEEAPEKEYLM